MLITDTWVQIAAAGCVLQRAGTTNLTLAYSSGEPAEGTDEFSVAHNLPQVFPAVGSKTLWARAKNGDVNISVEEISS